MTNGSMDGTDIHNSPIGLASSGRTWVRNDKLKLARSSRRGASKTSGSIVIAGVAVKTRGVTDAARNLEAVGASVGVELAVGGGEGDGVAEGDGVGEGVVVGGTVGIEAGKAVAVGGGARVSVGG